MSKKAPTQRERVYWVCKAALSPVTAEDVTRELIRQGVWPAELFARMVPSVRPRLTELAQRGLIRDSGLRGQGMNGCKAVAYEITTVDQIEAEAAKYRKAEIDTEALKAKAEDRANKMLETGSNPVLAFADALFHVLKMEAVHG